MRQTEFCWVEIKDQCVKLEVPRGSNLAQSLQKAGIYITTWCQLRGQCGRCAVDVLAGPQPAVSRQELLFQQKHNWQSFRRLACLLPVDGNMVISIPASSRLQDIPVLTKGVSIKTELNPAVKRFNILLPKASVKSPAAALDRLKKALRLRKISQLNPEVLRSVARLDQEEKSLQVIVYEAEEILAIEPDLAVSPLIGLAIDLGTTTLVVEALDLESGQSLGQEVSLNQQVRFGSDVLSRVAHASSGKENLEELRATIINDLNKMIDNICSRLKLSSENIWEAVIAGNAVMNHLFLGLPVEGLGRSPFSTLFSTLPSFPGLYSGLRMNVRGKIFLSPNIRSFIGGDITAGLLAANLFDSASAFAFLDLGTNGEIVVRGKGRLRATSTAAGSAFEGMNLSCGQIASDGAIERAEWEENGLKIKTVNNMPPRGICGSGLIDLLAVFLERGLISHTGRVESGRNRLEVAPGIFLTQEDIRQLQLACAAIKTGFRLLLDSLQLQPQDLEAVYVAGAFGQELSTKSSQAIGLIPRVDPERVSFLGNTSLAGARLLLLNRAVREKLNSLVDKIEFLSLASEPRFQACFLEALPFAPWP